MQFGGEMIGYTHPLIALAVQLALGIATGDWWIGVAASLMYVGRELAQAEYRWIERHGGGRRANMPWWGPFDLRVWDLHSLTDWLLPLVATGALAWLLEAAR